MLANYLFLLSLAIQIDIKDVSLQVIEHELLAEIILKVKYII